MPQPDRLNELPGPAGSICVACNIGTILPAQKINSNNVEGNKGQFFSKSSHPQNTSPQLPKQTVVLYGGLFQRGIIRSQKAQSIVFLPLSAVALGLETVTAFTGFVRCVVKPSSQVVSTMFVLNPATRGSEAGSHSTPPPSSPSAASSAASSALVTPTATPQKTRKSHGLNYSPYYATNTLPTGFVALELAREIKSCITVLWCQNEISEPIECTVPAPSLPHFLPESSAALAAFADLRCEDLKVFCVVRDRKWVGLATAIDGLSADTRVLLGHKSLNGKLCSWRTDQAKREPTSPILTASPSKKSRVDDPTCVMEIDDSDAETHVSYKSPAAVIVDVESDEEFFSKPKTGQAAPTIHPSDSAPVLVPFPPTYTIDVELCFSKCRDAQKAGDLVQDAFAAVFKPPFRSSNWHKQYSLWENVRVGKGKPEVLTAYLSTMAAGRNSDGLWAAVRIAAGQLAS
ncbi:hypothetical protein GGX14DRAFT_390944 [Mycena pura]|uniref:Uncharacterized protein n=1 Tax=Mycena pura TaxID=153505 RepID=A0AAD6VQQ0_9AGAR|nr:hypothetical protein GGX14DRAFT_390944 [Mycena pura]